MLQMSAGSFPPSYVWMAGVDGHQREFSKPKHGHQILLQRLRLQSGEQAMQVLDIVAKK